MGRSARTALVQLIETRLQRKQGVLDRHQALLGGRQDQTPAGCGSRHALTSVLETCTQRCEVDRLGRRDIPDRRVHRGHLLRHRLQVHRRDAPRGAPRSRGASRPVLARVRVLERHVLVVPAKPPVRERARRWRRPSQENQDLASRKPMEALACALIWQEPCGTRCGGSRATRLGGVVGDRAPRAIALGRHSLAPTPRQSVPRAPQRRVPGSDAGSPARGRRCRCSPRCGSCPGQARTSCANDPAARCCSRRSWRCRCRSRSARWQAGRRVSCSHPWRVSGAAGASAGRAVTAATTGGGASTAGAAMGGVKLPITLIAQV